MSLVTRLLVYLAYLSLVVIALLELGVRLVIPQQLAQFGTGELHLPDQAIGWSRAKNTQVRVNTGERDVLVCTDERGDRISCEEPRSESCSRRVLVIGDSFVEALAIPYEKTVWAHLERDFDACLHIAGVGAYYPGQYVIQARQRLIDQQDVRYDLVMLNLYSGNDFVDVIDWVPPSDIVAIPPFSLFPRGFSVRALMDWFYPINKWLEARSHLYVAGRSAVRDLIDPDRVAREGIPPAVLRSGLTESTITETARSVSLIAELSREHGAKKMLVVLPTRVQITDSTGEQLRSRYPMVASDIDMDLVSELFTPLVRQLPEVDVVVDLLDHFRESADEAAWGTRDPHFSPDGHLIWFSGVREAVSLVLNLE